MNDDDLDDDYGRTWPRGLGCLFAAIACAIIWGGIFWLGYWMYHQ
jgi:hypothetical protein